jgi:cytochrome P450
MPFSLQEAIIVLANLLRAFRFELMEGQEIAPQQRITLRPRRGMRMHVKRRESPRETSAENFFVKFR